MEYCNKRDSNLSFPDTSFHNLRTDCEKCFGFCCVALYFSASEGFPVDKAAGKPCPNLQSDFRCRVHKSLKKMGLKGCTAYDCFGAGQKVAQVTYGEQDWRKAPESAKQMYEVFLIMRQLHEMLWYLTEALTLQPASLIHGELKSMLNETERLTLKSPDSLIELDVAAHRAEVNALLLKTSELVRSNIRSGQEKVPRYRGLDLISADLRKANLKGEDLRGAYLIAADLRGVDLSWTDFIGADLRDTDIRGANLTKSIFLTQAQINTAKGDSKTKLPVALNRPIHW